VGEGVDAGVPLADLVREQLDHADASLSGPDRERHAAVEVGIRRDLLAQEVAGGDRVAQPHRPAALPDQADEALAGLEHELAAGALESLEIQAVLVPLGN